MTDRKRFSKRREENLWRIVDKAVTDLRIAALRGEFNSSNTAIEDRLWKRLGHLPDAVGAEYRRSLAP